MKRFSVIIPTYNPDEKFVELMHSLEQQKVQANSVIVIDSESIIDIVAKIKNLKVKIVKIKKQDFNHGGTRQSGVEMVQDADIVVFLTQDAILADEHALENLIKAFDDESIGAAYGRQLPHKDADSIAAHARLFNYPDRSRVKSICDIDELGIKTAFISNSFAAYRKSMLKEIGGFPEHVNLSEDTYVAAKMILKGWKIAYCADAKVYHSHNYSICQEFKRYFDIGVFQSRETWIKNKFGKAEKEGKKYIISEMKFLIQRFAMVSLVNTFFRNMFKYLAYQLGMKESFFSRIFKRKISMNKSFWKGNGE